VQLTEEEVAEIRKYSDECEPAGERSWKPHLVYADSAPLETIAEKSETPDLLG